MKKKVGLGIPTFLPLFAATVESRACIGHFLQEQWPPHEVFHLLMGLSGLLAAYVLILVLVCNPLRNGQRWAWFAIAAAALIVNMPPVPDPVTVIFPEPLTAPLGLIVLTMYDLPPVLTLSENISPDVFCGRHRDSLTDRCPSLC